MKTMAATAVQSTALAPFQRCIGARDVTLYVVTGTDGEPWFRANDVAHAVEHGSTIPRQPTTQSSSFCGGEWLPPGQRSSRAACASAEAVVYAISEKTL